ncbi:MAG TPA: hypothetical protein VHX13_11055 [Acidobacteriaceae bacterium]|nr:hypothetical protein [Acidobacteriaceae bacterium]
MDCLAERAGLEPYREATLSRETALTCQRRGGRIELQLVEHGLTPRLQEMYRAARRRGKRHASLLKLIDARSVAIGPPDASGGFLILGGDQFEISPPHQLFFWGRSGIEHHHIDIVEGCELLGDPTGEWLVLDPNLLAFLKCHTQKAKTL